MTNLLVMREHLKRFYSKYEAYITPVGKFLLAAAAILLINSEIGYMGKLKGGAVVLILSLICVYSCAYVLIPADEFYCICGGVG